MAKERGEGIALKRAGPAWGLGGEVATLNGSLVEPPAAGRPSAGCAVTERAEHWVAGAEPAADPSQGARQAFSWRDGERATASTDSTASTNSTDSTDSTPRRPCCHGAAL